MDAWPRCLERLEAELPAEDVHTWLKPLQATWRDDTTVLYAPNAFVRDEVRARYLDRIRELLGHFAGSAEVTLEIGSLPKAPSAAMAPAQAGIHVQRAADFVGNLDNHYTFDNFVEGRSNQLGRAGPGGGEGHSDPAVRPRVAVGRVGGGLLVADAHEAHGRLAEGPPQGQVVDPGKAERHVDARVLERCHGQAGACQDAGLR